MKKTIKVLSIDGGGTRGLLPATMLHQLEQETGQSVTDIFDVIVGSATGGIITSAIAAGMSMEDIMDIYLKQAKFILPSNFFRRIWNPLNLFAPRYPNKNLKALLEEKFGSKTLKDVREEYGTDTIFLAGTLNLSPELKADEWPSFKIEVYNSILAEYENERVVDVALRTSAAPINLPLYQHYSEAGVYANDPAMIALSFCMNHQQAKEAGASYLENNRLGLGARHDEIKFLSVGCGTDGRSFVPLKKIRKGNWGMLKWFGALISLIIDDDMAANQYYLRQFLDEDHYYRLNAYYKAEDAPDILKNKKLRIDVRDAEQLEAIKEYAKTIFEKEKEKLKVFLEL
jgi:patatin-like phospholipase/acyl hydrolase